MHASRILQASNNKNDQRQYRTCRLVLLRDDRRYTRWIPYGHKLWLEHRPEEVQLPVQHRKRIQDKERKHRRNGQRTNVRRHNTGILELLRRHCQQEELGVMGHTELWEGPAWPDYDHGTWSVT